MAINAKTLDVQHDTANQRFTAEVNGHVGQVKYQLEDNVMIVTSTQVPPPIEGQGVAGRITQVALEYAREHGYSVIPKCPYTAAYVKRHTDTYADLVDPAVRG